MSEKKIVVPDGMLKAFYGAETHDGYFWEKSALKKMLEASLRWLSENPIVPTDEQLDEMEGDIRYRVGVNFDIQKLISEWQRRMFLAPKPEVPEEIADLRMLRPQDCNHLKANARIIEAYRRGLKAGQK